MEQFSAPPKLRRSIWQAILLLLSVVFFFWAYIDVATDRVNTVTVDFVNALFFKHLSFALFFILMDRLIQIRRQQNLIKVLSGKQE